MNPALSRQAVQGNRIPKGNKEILDTSFFPSISHRDAIFQVVLVSDVVPFNIKIDVDLFKLNTVSIWENRLHTNSSSVANLTFVENHFLHNSGERNRKPLGQESLLFFPQFFNR
jgi:hypothetical protein